MKKTYLQLVSAALLLGASFSSLGQTFSPASSEIRYTGRWNFDNPARPWVGWQGSTMTVKFTGSSLTLDLDTGDTYDYFQVIVDGVPQNAPIRINKGRKQVQIVSGLSTTEPHTVTFMKETFYGSNLTIYGLTIPNGQLHSLPARPNMRISFFGDSNMDGTSLYSEKDQVGNETLSKESGTYYGYPATVTRMLGAEMNLQAIGGATLTGNGDNTVANFIFSEDYYTQNSNYRDGFNPHVIVVNAGANDISSVKGKRKTNKMKNRFKQVVNSLRQVYGNSTHIVLHNGYGWDSEEPANYTHALAAEIGGNISAVHYPWMWEQWHGSMVEQAGQARLLAQHIANLNIGFNIVQDAEVFDGFGRNFNVANGSFEEQAKNGFNAFGWRYVADGVERIRNANQAADGEYYIALDAGEEVHQGTDATGDFERGATSGNQTYVVRAMIRAKNGNGTATISADYEGQGLYNRGDKETEVFAVEGQWKEYVATFTAPNGTWKTYISLGSNSGTVEFDNVRMSEN
ncbi:GDSL-type esterase/lipase family protein [Thalassotalea agarivorans]|uniref:GDSL-like Lipase/Acylhydrolase n=1 Tax=Thalassotalea agarivorans TaxID=349064 RepID=A0A1I0DNX3_THASX|nr:GDSL-type esterase/lipase family protein [Thalassotalea agarivorans]SET34050.1 GDSL-like Lipase/Acylhydrolase [Thalassotalea agarivorans]